MRERVRETTEKNESLVIRILCRVPTAPRNFYAIASCRERHSRALNIYLFFFLSFFFKHWYLRVGASSSLEVELYTVPLILTNTRTFLTRRDRLGVHSDPSNLYVVTVKHASSSRYKYKGSFRGRKVRRVGKISKFFLSTIVINIHKNATK